MKYKVAVSSSTPFEYQLQKDDGEEWQMARVSSLPKPKTTAEWLAFIAIDMHVKGYTLKQIGKRIDRIPEDVKKLRKRKYPKKRR